MELLFTTVAFRSGLNTFIILCDNVQGVYFKTFTFDSNVKEFLINESLAHLRWCYLVIINNDCICITQHNKNAMHVPDLL